MHSYDFDELIKDRKFGSSVKLSAEEQIILDHHILDRTEPHFNE